MHFSRPFQSFFSILRNLTLPILWIKESLRLWFMALLDFNQAYRATILGIYVLFLTCSYFRFHYNF